MLILSWLSSTDSAPNQVINRLEYGFAAYDPRPICVVDGYVPHVIHFRLTSEREILNLDLNSSRVLHSKFRQTVELTTPIFLALEDLRESFYFSVRQWQERISHLIPDVDVLARKRRGWFNFVGSASKWLFGTATSQDMSDLRDLVQNATRLFELSAADARQVREGLSSFVSLSNARFDLVNQGLTQQRQSLIALATELHHVDDELSIITALMTRVIIRTAHYNSLKEALLALEHGLEQLARRILSPLLIVPDQARQILKGVQESMGAHKSLCVNDLRQFYALKTFEFARIKNDIAIRLRFPFTTSNGMVAYELATTDFLLPSNLAAVSYMSLTAKVVVMNPQGGAIALMADRPESFMISRSEVMRGPEPDLLCIRALLTNSKSLIAEKCEFKVAHRMPRVMNIQLSRDHFLVNGYADLRIVSPNETRFIENCTPCVIKVPCGAQLSVNDENLIPLRFDCINDSSDAGVNILQIRKYWTLL